MKRFVLLLAALLMAAIAAPLHAQGPAGALALRALFADEWERSLRESPESATYNGDARYNDRWTDYSLEAIAARGAADRAALERLRAIDRAALPPAEQLQYDTFEWQLQRSVERQRFREHLQPIDHQGGPQTADLIQQVTPFATAADHRKFIARMAALPRLIEQAVQLMREGVKAGQVPPRVLIQRVPAQIGAQIVEDPARSPFYKPFLKISDAIPAAERTALQAEARTVIRERIVPAYRALKVYFDNEYLPRTRLSIAVSDQPNGKDYYDFLARYYTTTELDADAIHAIGLKEVARLRAAMETVKAETGFRGTLAQFFVHLRTDPKFFHKTPAALLNAYRATAKRIDPELVKVFKTLPRLPYGVRPIPDSIAPDTTTAYYQGGAPDGTRAGYYHVNLYKPQARPTWEMLPLTLHEAVPGHHLQFARALELADAPMLLKTAYFVAYGEGWALYAERLGYDMGLYDDPYDRFGQLTYEMWRAVRLVVDTGIHTKGWSRERAIAYFRDNAAKTEQDIVNEIDRYIGTPGQALAYKIGQMKISELRARAKRELGAQFDLRDYNDAVLETGSVPLAALEARIDAWIARRK
jgi:uncharacterized protein (DUF885 family)